MNFKPGDTVLCIDAKGTIGFIREGKTYTVTATHTCACKTWLRLRDDPSSTVAYRFAQHFVCKRCWQFIPYDVWISLRFIKLRGDDIKIDMTDDILGDVDAELTYFWGRLAEEDA